MTKRTDLTGLRFGKLVVVSYSHSKNGAIWSCICDCGSESVVPARSLNYGSTRSCGCGALAQARENVIRASVKRSTGIPNIRKLKDLLHNMRMRCYSAKNKRFANYGARGINICDEWNDDCRSFYAWANKNGYAPGLQIDRIDVNGNYSPDNCRFVGSVAQMNNTTRNHFIEWDGRRQTIAQWEREFGWPKGRLQARFSMGWTIERAMTQPPRLRRAA